MSVARTVLPTSLVGCIVFQTPSFLMILLCPTPILMITILMWPTPTRDAAHGASDNKHNTKKLFVFFRSFEINRATIIVGVIVCRLLFSNCDQALDTK